MFVKDIPDAHTHQAAVRIWRVPTRHSWARRGRATLKQVNLCFVLAVEASRRDEARVGGFAAAILVAALHLYMPPATCCHHKRPTKTWTVAQTKSNSPGEGSATPAQAATNQRALGAQREDPRRRGRVLLISEAGTFVVRIETAPDQKTPWGDVVVQGHEVRIQSAASELFADVASARTCTACCGRLAVVSLAVVSEDESTCTIAAKGLALAGGKNSGSTPGSLARGNVFLIRTEAQLRSGKGTPRQPSFRDLAVVWRPVSLLRIRAAHPERATA